MAHSRNASSPDWPADLQNGVLTRSQARSAGVIDQAIATNLRRGRWQRLHPGVYATFSGVLPGECFLWAAVLRAGPRAVLSHQTAARLWGLSGPATAAVHVTVPRGSPVTAAPGLIVHYSQRVAAARHPTLTPSRTTVEETALDLANAAATAEDAVAWMLRAVASRRTTPEHLAVAVLADLDPAVAQWPSPCSSTCRIPPPPPAPATRGPAAARRPSAHASPRRRAQWPRKASSSHQEP